MPLEEGCLRIIKQHNINHFLKTLYPSAAGAVFNVRSQLLRQQSARCQNFRQNHFDRHTCRGYVQLPNDDAGFRTYVVVCVLTAKSKASFKGSNLSCGSTTEGYAILISRWRLSGQ